MTDAREIAERIVNEAFHQFDDVEGRHLDYSLAGEKALVDRIAAALADAERRIREADIRAVCGLCRLRPDAPARCEDETVPIDKRWWFHYDGQGGVVGNCEAMAIRRAALRVEETP